MKVLPCFAVLLSAAAAVTAEAQVELLGRVIEHTSEEAIVGATVTLQDARGRRLARQVTDDFGQFKFVVREVRSIRLLAEHVGYQRTTTPDLHFDDYTLYRVEVRMDQTAVPLAALEVVARSRTGVAPSLAGFERRRQSGVVGSFITREDIERRNPMRVGDLLERVPGLWMQHSRGTNRRIVYFSRSRNCPAQIFVDGFHMNRPVRSLRGRSTTDMFPIDDVVQPGDVEGIEIYQGLSRLPSEFVTPDSHCGVVAVWTRRG